MNDTNRQSERSRSLLVNLVFSAGRPEGGEPLIISIESQGPIVLYSDAALHPWRKGGNCYISQEILRRPIGMSVDSINQDLRATLKVIWMSQ